MRTTMTAHDQQEPGNALASPARARARLGRALLGYLLGGIGVVTLMPLRFQWPSHLPDLWQTNWFDIGANICLFVPLGFVYRLGSTAPGSPARLQAWCFGAAVSLGLELTQLFLPGRYPCLSDVLANSLGMWLG